MFKSTRVTEFEDRFRETTVLRHYPSLLGELTCAAGVSGALLMAGDMNKKGFTQYAAATKYSAGALLGAWLLAEVIGRTVNWTRASNSTEARTKTELVPLKVLDHDRVVASLSTDRTGMAAFDLRKHLSSLGEPPRDLTLTVRMQDTDSASRSLSVSQNVFASAVEKVRAESVRVAEAARLDAEREAEAERMQRLAEERRGTLAGTFPNATGIPPACQSAKVVEGVRASVLTGDLWGTFPVLDAQYKTELERENFLASHEADSFRALVRSQKAELLRGVYAMRVSSSHISNYDTKMASFSVDFGEVTGISGYGTQERENEYGRSRAAHVVGGVWFDDLPLRAVTLLGMSVAQYLDVSVPSRNRALEIERRRDSLEVWVAFRLTGSVRRLSSPSLPIFNDEVHLFPEASNSVVMLVDTGKGDVVWKNR